VHVDIEGVQLETVGLAEPPTPPDGAEPDYSFPVFQLPEDLAAEFRGADSGWNCYMIENRTSRCTVDDDGFFYVEVM
jgi:hypothetical protein